MANTVRRPRSCEVCGVEYRPTYHQQRTCGRLCGAVIHRIEGRRPWPASKVTWRQCATCLQWVTTRSDHRHVKDTAWMTRVIECPVCGEGFTNPFTTIAIHCSSRCSRKASKLRRRVREVGSYGEWRWSDFMRIARKFDYCCAYCGDKPDRLDPDHVVPLSKGGPNIIGNLLPTCASCNSDKQAFTLDEWTQRLALQGRARRTSWSVDDSRYWHLTTVVPPLAHTG